MPSPVVLVNEHDEVLGTAKKLRAHTEGWLHRALSVFIFDDDGRLLLQQRAADKYHSGGLWSNTCCSHPHPDELPQAAARRRLHEEMGFTCPVTPAFHFTYQAPVGPSLTEHEYDHVFVGTLNGATIKPNGTEVADWTWMSPPALRADVAAHPDRYTVWFRRLLGRVLAKAPSTNASVSEATSS
jgi:isopentenyl-diphosphate delta-isomerase